MSEHEVSLGLVNKQKTQPQAQIAVQYWTRAELALRWRVSTETIKRREQAGILRALKLGRGVRYRQSDIEQIERDAEVVR